MARMRLEYDPRDIRHVISQITPLTRTVYGSRFRGGRTRADTGTRSETNLPRSPTRSPISISPTGDRCKAFPPPRKSSSRSCSRKIARIRTEFTVKLAHERIRIYEVLSYRGRVRGGRRSASRSVPCALAWKKRAIPALGCARAGRLRGKPGVKATNGPHERQAKG